MAQATFDHERLEDYCLSIEYVAFSDQIAKGLTGITRRGSESPRQSGLVTDRLDADAIDPTKTDRG